jgi:hypothetical protein
MPICRLIGRNTALRFWRSCANNSPICTSPASSSSPKLSASKLMLKPTTAKPKTIEGVLQQVEAEAGPEGRKAFEGFLRKMVRIKEEQGDSSPRKLGDERG